MGLLFHSICLLTSCRPQLHTCEPVTVALHTSLQPGSSWTHFNSWQKSFVFRRTLEHRNGLWTKRTWMRQHFVLVIRLQRSLTNYALPALEIIAPHPHAAVWVIVFLTVTTPEGLALTLDPFQTQTTISWLAGLKVITYDLKPEHRSVPGTLLKNKTIFDRQLL